MIIGIDGNEANIKNRVGSNIYAYQILFSIWKSQITNHKSQNKTEFIIYLKNKSLGDMPEEKEWWKYRVLKPRVLWTKWRLPLELILNKDKIDVFFTPGHYAPGICPAPLIISIMDLAFLKYPDQFKKKDLVQLKTWTRKSVEKATKILTISENTKNDIIRYYRVKEDRVRVTYPAISESKMINGNEKILEKYNLKKGKYFVFVGTLQPRKNLIRLIRAFRKLINTRRLKSANTNSLIKLVVIGKKGWLYDDIFKEVKKQKLEDRIIFTGFASEEEKSGLLKNSYAFVLPSLYEGFGFPVLEAMKAGVPVVVSKVSSLPEVGGNAAIYIDDPESVEAIYQGLKRAMVLSDSERNELIEKGKEQVKKFSWKRTAEQTLEIIKEVGAN